MRRSCLFILLCLTALATCAPQRARGQVVRQAVGGVSVNAHGVVEALTRAQRAQFAATHRNQLAPAPPDLLGTTEMRMVSLRGLQAELAAARQAAGPLSEDVRYLAGLQRVEFVLAYPERHDIVLAGPAEGWQLGPTGDIVGVTTGLPVLELDDLLVALRTTDAARQVGITCSIDPTPAGRQSLDQYLKQQRRFHPAVAEGVKQALGPQLVTITGVPADSHFAGVLVASDYRMKCLAMNLETAPIEGLPGFLDLLQSRRGGLNNLMPRWWMACHYDSLARSQDGLSWQLRGQGVRVMTEDEIIAADGSVTGSGQVNPVAREWADTMTEKYETLSRQEPVFAQLRNLMDLCVVAALIEQEDLLTQADCDLSLLCDVSSPVGIEKWNVPRAVPTESSFVKKGRNYIITASGGVQIDSWAAAARSEVVPAIGQHRDAAGTGSGWRWN